MEILSCVAYSLIGILTLWVSNLLHFFYSQVLRRYNYPTGTIGRNYLTYRLGFVANFIVMVLLMKGASWLVHKKRDRVWWKFFFTTPHLSLRSKEHTNLEPQYL